MDPVLIPEPRQPIEQLLAFLLDAMIEVADEQEVPLFLAAVGPVHFRIEPVQTKVLTIGEPQVSEDSHPFEVAEEMVESTHNRQHLVE